MFIKVERSDQAPCVTLSGPSTVLEGIASRTTSEVMVMRSSLEGTMEIRLTTRQGADNSMFMKATLLEGVLKRGFIPTSNVTDDLLVLSREVYVDPGFIF